MKRYKVLYILFFLFILFVLYAIFYFLKPTVKPQGLVTVSVSPVIKQDVLVRLQTIGTVQPYASVQVGSMVTGPLISAGFKEGDLVEKNQILFEIDKRPYVAALEQAKANLIRDQATLANNETQLKRNEKLAQKGYISKQGYDTLLATTKSSAAIVEASKAAVDNAKLQLSYTTIRAPISGKTGNILLKPGSVIKETDTNLVTINQINPIYVSFSVPQNKLSIIQENIHRQLVQVTAKINDTQIEKGNITFIDNTVNTATGSIQIKATFLNQEHKLWPGQYVTIDLPLEQIQQAYLIPSLAVLTGQKGFYVFVVDENSTVRIRDVVLGSAVNDKIVIKKGLQPGEKVVTAGQLRLQDGNKVNISSQ